MVTPHHNVLGGAAADQLRAYVVRLEGLDAQIERLNGLKRVVYGEATACGINKDVLRRVVRRRQSPTERPSPPARGFTQREEDELVEAYEDILHMVES